MIDIRRCPPVATNQAECGGLSAGLFPIDISNWSLTAARRQKRLETAQLDWDY
jgi:hypothetical protein